MAEEVKDHPRATERRSILRHLEGWQPGLLAVVIAVLGALLGIPRAVPPDVLPLPNVDVRECQRANATEEKLAREALGAVLPFEVRAAGEAFRRFGAANAAGNSGLATDQLAEVRQWARAALKLHGEAPLLRLESLQTEMFLDTLTRWERGENVETELAELGGNFVEKAKSDGWLADSHRLAASLSERRVLFRVRWVDVTGLRDQAALAPTANDWRLYYRFLLLHPERSGKTQATEQQLRYVSVIEKVDLEYPSAFARGVLLFRLGQWAKSEASFRAHLSQENDGAWRLRARNHLLAAGERARQSAPDPLEE